MNNEKLVRCIYCNKSILDGIKINESHIIPDALTNYKKLVYSNVCSEDHNKVFGDTFECDIIQKCIKIRHYLNIKNKKGKILKYKDKFKINGYEFNGPISKFENLFDGRIIPVKKNNMKFILKIVEKKDEGYKKFKEVFDVLKITKESETRKEEIENIIKMLYSENMLRLAAKIGYEWFCMKNNINGVQACFNDIIEYITNNACQNKIVSIINNNAILEKINDELGYGGHALAIYNTSVTKNAYVLFSFFGLVMYKIKIREYPIFIANSVNFMDRMEFFGIRYDGSIINSIKTYANNYEEYCLSVDPYIAIKNLRPSIITRYNNLLYEHIITLKAFKPYIIEINKLFEKYSAFSDDEFRYKLVAHQDANVISVIYTIYLLGKKENGYVYEDSFQENIKRIFNNADKLVISKNIEDKLMELNSQSFKYYLKVGLSIFQKEYNKA